MWSDTPCKIWKGKFSGTGYPVIHHKGKKISVTRQVLEEKLKRPVKVGYEVCHHCDVKSCTEAEHLWEGTHAENMRDARRKGIISKFWGNRVHLKEHK